MSRAVPRPVALTYTGLPHSICNVRSHNPRSRLSALLALASFLLSMPQGVLVACVGVGGQVRIEVSSSEPLLTEMAPPVRTDLVSSADPCTCGDGCGPCRETEIGLEDMTFHLPATDCAIGSALAHAVPFAYPADGLGQPLVLIMHPAASGGPPHSPPGLRRIILRV